MLRLLRHSLNLLATTIMPLSHSRQPRLQRLQRCESLLQQPPLLLLGHDHGLGLRILDACQSCPQGVNLLKLSTYLFGL